MRILIVEDDLTSQAWLRKLVEKSFEAAECTLAATLSDARQRIDEARWDLALVDIALPDGSGINLIEETVRKGDDLLAIITTIFDDDDNIFRALAAGAHGYLLKSQPEEHLVQQLRMMADGQPPMSPSIARRLLAHFRQPHVVPAVLAPGPAPAPLTRREAEVLAAIGKGLRTREVAARLGLAEQTVATYVRDLYSKLNIRSRAQAALEAARRGLL